MLVSTQTISTELRQLGKRVVKFLRYGLKDFQTADQISPFGIDSNPIAKMTAIYGKTSNNGSTVIIGYMNPNMLSDVGELRLFSTNAQGSLKMHIWLKNDGTAEFGGDANNLTRYQDLETAFNELKGDFNGLVQAFNTHMHATAATGPPSIPTPGSGIPAMPSNADISPAKIEELKTL